MTIRLQLIGDVERPQHYYLDESHKCYFFGEYTPWEYTNGKKWNFSETNQLISNLKKGMDRKGKSDWHHKQAAISQVSQVFSKLWKWDVLHAAGVMLVPIPPSKSLSDSMYDDRITQILLGIKRLTGYDLNINDVLKCDGSIPTSHTSSSRPSPSEIYDALSVNFECVARTPKPKVIFLFDDVLTTGAHFVAASRKLSEHFPEVPIVGNFVARTVRPNPLPSFEEI